VRAKRATIFRAVPPGTYATLRARGIYRYAADDAACAVRRPPRDYHYAVFQGRRAPDVSHAAVSRRREIRLQRAVTCVSPHSIRASAVRVPPSTRRHTRPPPVCVCAKACARGKAKARVTQVRQGAAAATPLMCDARALMPRLQRCERYRHFPQRCFERCRLYASFCHVSSMPIAHIC